MKVCVVQPPYSMEKTGLQACEEKLFALLDECDESLDLIVLPEYSDNLADEKEEKDFTAAVERYNAEVLEKAAETAKRRWRGVSQYYVRIQSSRRRGGEIFQGAPCAQRGKNLCRGRTRAGRGV